MRDLTVQTPAAVPARQSVYALIDEWSASLGLAVEAGDITAATRATYEQALNRFVAWAEHHTTVDQPLILTWKAELHRQKLRPNTVNTWLAGVRAFFNWALTNGRIAYNPAAGVRGARRSGTKQKHLREALSPAEVLRVLARPDTTTPAGTRDSAILHLMAYTAARAVEIHRADLADLRTESGRLVLRVQGKGRVETDEKLVIVHPDAEQAMHAWLAARRSDPGPLFTSLSNRSQGGRLSLRAIRALVKHYYAEAGVAGTGKTTHSLRHTAITAAILHGAPIQKVQGMARHANIATTMIYYHEADRVQNPAEAFISYGEEQD